MPAYRSAFAVSKPEGNKKIPRNQLAYLRTRNRLKAFDLLQDEFRRSGISQATLAARCRTDPGRLSRLFNAPGNLTLDTLSDLLFAMSGAVPEYSCDHPLERPARNMTRPEWATDNLSSNATNANIMVGSWKDAEAA